MITYVEPKTIAELNACLPDEHVRLSHAVILTGGGGEEAAEAARRYYQFQAWNFRLRRTTLSILRAVFVAGFLMLYATLLYKGSSISLALWLAVPILAFLMWMVIRDLSEVDRDIAINEKMFSDDFSISVEDLRRQLAQSGNMEVKAGPWEYAQSKRNKSAQKRTAKRKRARSN